MTPKHRTATHPGVILREDFMVPLGLKPHDLAESTGLSAEIVCDLLTEKIDVTFDVAVKLASALGDQTLHFWLDAQHNHDRSKLDAESRHICEVFTAVDAELTSAMSKYPPMHSAHEGWATLFEEVDELWDEVKKRPDRRDVAALRAEAIQVAAMAVRFVLDCCPVEDAKPAYVPEYEWSGLWTSPPVKQCARCGMPDSDGTLYYRPRKQQLECGACLRDMLELAEGAEGTQAPTLKCANKCRARGH